ncbi:RNA polymerase I enhancer binding protein [Quaeritorhiza haematococci]|nr:RNA polymerase I enhancer binding protein [Quaeritorhiza haematococci]
MSITDRSDKAERKRKSKAFLADDIDTQRKKKARREHTKVDDVADVREDISHSTASTVDISETKKRKKKAKTAKENEVGSVVKVEGATVEHIPPSEQSKKKKNKKKVGEVTMGLTSSEGVQPDNERPESQDEDVGKLDKVKKKKKKKSSQEDAQVPSAGHSEGTEGVKKKKKKSKAVEANAPTSSNPILAPGVGGSEKVKKKKKSVEGRAEAQAHAKGLEVGEEVKIIKSKEEDTEASEPANGLAGVEKKKQKKKKKKKDGEGGAEAPVDGEVEKVKKKKKSKEGDGVAERPVDAVAEVEKVKKKKKSKEGDGDEARTAVDGMVEVEETKKKKKKKREAQAAANPDVDHADGEEVKKKKKKKAKETAIEETVVVGHVDRSQEAEKGKKKKKKKGSTDVLTEERGPANLGKASELTEAKRKIPDSTLSQGSVDNGKKTDDEKKKIKRKISEAETSDAQASSCENESDVSITRKPKRAKSVRPATSSNLEGEASKSKKLGPGSVRVPETHKSSIRRQSSASSAEMSSSSSDEENVAGAQGNSSGVTRARRKEKEAENQTSSSANSESLEKPATHSARTLAEIIRNPTVVQQIGGITHLGFYKAAGKGIKYADITGVVKGTFTVTEKEAVHKAIMKYLKERSIPESDLELLIHRKSAPVGSTSPQDNPYNSAEYSDFYDYVHVESGIQRLRDSLYYYLTYRYNSAKGQGPWTEEEDRMLLELVAQGKKWSEIDRDIGRPHCRERHRQLEIKTKGFALGRWSSEEDMALLQAVRKLFRLPDGTIDKKINWGAVEKEVKTRSARQCAQAWRSRVFRMLDPTTDTLREHPTVNPRLKWTLSDLTLFLTRLSELPARDESEINWFPFCKLLISEGMSPWAPEMVQNGWKRLKKKYAPDMQLKAAARYCLENIRKIKEYDISEFFVEDSDVEDNVEEAAED